MTGLRSDPYSSFPFHCYSRAVDVTFGRIGSRGRTIRHIASGEADAKKIVRHCLQRRGTAKRRIGVSYQVSELAAANGWAEALPPVSGR